MFDFAVVIIAFSLPVVWIMFLIFYFLLLHRFFSLLKSDHVDVWEELGRPSLMANNSIFNSIAVTKYLSAKKFMSINDENFIVLCMKINKVRWSLAIMFVILALSIMYMTIKTSFPN